MCSAAFKSVTEKMQSREGSLLLQAEHLLAFAAAQLQPFSRPDLFLASIFSQLLPIWPCLFFLYQRQKVSLFCFGISSVNNSVHSYILLLST